MKVIVFGATGNLGSRLLPALLAHEHQVVVYVRNERKLKEIVDPAVVSQLTVVTGDATDAEAIKDALVKHQCDALVNSAGGVALFPWQAPQMQGIVNAVSTAAVDASRELKRPIRGWFLGGFMVLDFPGQKGIKINRYVPLFSEHSLTFDCLTSKPQEHLEWSLFSPAYMRPASQTITLLEAPRGNSFSTAVDVPPGWQPSYFARIPLLGTFLTVVGNVLRYNTDLEDCADFLAADLAKPNRSFVGHRVSVKESGKGKVQ
ncbi:hypothetical protein MMC13_003896 [Lambiella insularis]|nr:hypothetical protein [Lambiella insularis]